MKRMTAKRMVEALAEGLEWKCRGCGADLPPGRTYCNHRCMGVARYRWNEARKRAEKQVAEERFRKRRADGF